MLQSLPPLKGVIMMTQQGSESRQRILNLVVANFQDAGTPITIREIIETLGFKSTSSVVFHLDKLVKENYLEKYNGHVYPVGFRNKIRDLAKKEFAYISKEKP